MNAKIDELEYRVKNLEEIIVLLFGSIELDVLAKGRCIRDRQLDGILARLKEKQKKM